jgi:DNA polymerase III subunit delta
MILFLYGEDTYRSRAKLRAIRDRYLEGPAGEANFIRLVAPEIKLADFEQAAFSAPFLARTRLVMVEGLLTLKTKDGEQIIESLEGLPSSTVAVLWEEGVPDRRSKLWKRLNELAKVEEFPLLDEARLRSWIGKRVTELGGTTSPLVVDLIARSVGPDLWRLENELAKLVNYSSEVTAEAVALLLAAPETEDIFALVDSIGEGKSRQALALAHALLSGDRGELYLLSMIARQFRVITLVRYLRGKGLSEAAIAKRIALHPFVVRKAAAQAKHFATPQLKEAYRLLKDADLRLKNTAQEGAVVIDLLIAELCSLSSRSEIRQA